MGVRMRNVKDLKVIAVLDEAIQNEFEETMEELKREAKK